MSLASLRRYRRGCIDVFLFLTVLLPVLVYKFLEIPPLGGSWNCQDKAIRFPHNDDSVSTKVLLIGILVPIFFIVLVTECVHRAGLGLLSMFRVSLLTSLTIYAKYFTFLTANIFINFCLKILCSIPRPHFIDTCQPDWDNINCDENGGNIMFSASQCLSPNMREVFDSMKSFPSGHAQLATFTAAFLIVYFQRRIPLSVSSLLRLWLQLLVTLLAALTATSRLVDARHHLSDVVVGAALGLILGYLGASQSLTEDCLGTSYSPTQPDTKKETEHKPVKQKRPSKMRLLSSEFGSIMEAEKELRETNPNPAC